MENDSAESAYEKGMPLEEAVKSALQDMADCPELSAGFASRVETMIGRARPVRHGKAFKIAASIAACVALAGLVFAAAVAVNNGSLAGLGGEGAAPDLAGGDELAGLVVPFVPDSPDICRLSTADCRLEANQGETEMNINIKKKAALAAAAATAVGIAPSACAGLTSATSAPMASFSSFAAHGGMSQPALTESFHSFVSQTVETGTLPKFNSSEPRGMQIIFR